MVRVGIPHLISEPVNWRVVDFDFPQSLPTTYVLTVEIVAAGITARGEKNMSRIENKKTYHGEGIYVGREMRGVPGSVLGNPFQIGRD